jgi:hypothetical protein
MFTAHGEGRPGFSSQIGETAPVLTAHWDCGGGFSPHVCAPRSVSAEPWNFSLRVPLQSSPYIGNNAVHNAGFFSVTKFPDETASG